MTAGGASASIDDLLGHDEEVAPAASRRGGRVRSWLRLGFAAAVLTAAVVLGLRMVGIGVPVPAVAAGFLALLLLRRVTTRLASSLDPLRAPDDEPDDPERALRDEDALIVAIRSWESELSQAQGRSDRFREVVLPLLRDLADERLRQRHGITRASDPARARQLLGERLWRLLDTPPKRIPAPRDLAALVAELEQV